MGLFYDKHNPQAVTGISFTFSTLVQKKEIYTSQYKRHLYIMISSTNLRLLPDSKDLKAYCKSMAVLDAILSQDWIYRYYSYNSDWSTDEEFFEMRNGEGGQLLILFRKEGTVINGFSADAEEGDKEKLTAQLPAVFQEFMFGEPVSSTGTTFCIWQLEGESWKTGIASENDNHSEELLSALHPNPASYTAWATTYFNSFKQTGIPIDVVTRIYAQEALTKEMVLSIVRQLEDWELLQEDLAEISYPYHINQ